MTLRSAPSPHSVDGSMKAREDSDKSQGTWRFRVRAWGIVPTLAPEPPFVDPSLWLSKRGGSWLSCFWAQLAFSLGRDFGPPALSGAQCCPLSAHPLKPRTGPSAQCWQNLHPAPTAGGLGGAGRLKPASGSLWKLWGVYRGLPGGP